MNEKSSIKAMKDHDFGVEANPIVVKLIRDFEDNNSITDEQQDLIVEEYNKFIQSNSPEKKLFTLAVREVDFVIGDDHYERMIEIFRLSGHAGEGAGDIQHFVHNVVGYPDEFESRSEEIISLLAENGETERYADEIALFHKYNKMSLKIDSEKLAYLAALDWINTCIEKEAL